MMNRGLSTKIILALLIALTVSIPTTRAQGVLLSKSFEVKPLHYHSENFTVDTDNLLVSVRVNVSNGVGVDVLLLDEKSMETFRRQIIMGYYDVDAYIVGQNITSMDNKTRLGMAGVYYMVVINWHLNETSNVTVSISEIREGSKIVWATVMLMVSIAVVALVLYVAMKLKRL